MSILVIAEHDNQNIKPSTLSVLSAAKALSAPIDVLVAGEGCDAVVAALSQYGDIACILQADDPVYAHPLAETLAPLIVSLADSKTHILAPATTFGKNILPRVAALLDVGQVSDVIAIHDAKTFLRPMYAGNVIAKVVSSDPIQVLTIRPTAFAPCLPGPGNVNVERVSTVIDNTVSHFMSREVSNSTRPDLSSAEIVVSGGRGLKNAETFARLTAIADRLGAAVGASRAAVDAGLAPNDQQVGQTGQVVAPKLYIAVGISGAIQHVAGMKDSQVIVAINKDPDAPIFQIADYGLVADLFDALPEIETVLQDMGYKTA